MPSFASEIHLSFSIDVPLLRMVPPFHGTVQIDELFRFARLTNSVASRSRTVSAKKKRGEKNETFPQNDCSDGATGMCSRHDACPFKMPVLQELPVLYLSPGASIRNNERPTQSALP